MANKGTLGGQELMKESTWETLHGAMKIAIDEGYSGR